MKLATIQKAERAAFRLLKVFEAEAKTDPEAKRLKELASVQWQDFYNRLRRMSARVFEFKLRRGGASTLNTGPSVRVRTGNARRRHVGAGGVCGSWFVDVQQRTDALSPVRSDFNGSATAFQKQIRKVVAA